MNWNNKKIILLFGMSFSGGTQELKKSKYARFQFYSPEIDHNTSELKILDSLCYKKCQLSILHRIWSTVRFIKLNQTSTFYLTHSIQALILPRIFPKISFIWICQGIEIFFSPFSMAILRIPTFLLLTQKNLQISIVNFYLLKFVQDNLQNGNIAKDPFINLQIAQGKRIKGKEISKRKKHFFVCLRDSACKNQSLAADLVHFFENDLSYKWTILDLRENQTNFKQNVNINYIPNKVSHSELLELLKECDYLLYTSYFEGFGLLVNEAIELGVTPIIGPDCLFIHHPKIIAVANYKKTTWIKQISRL